MKKFLLPIFLLTHLFFVAHAYAEAPGAERRLLKAQKVFVDWNKSHPDTPITAELLSKARTVIIFPSFGEGGFLYGARFGLGVVVHRDEIGGSWSAPAFLRISGGSFGLQLGYQNNELILVGKERFDLEHFNGGPAVGGVMSGSFGPWGAHSEKGTGWESGNKMTWFSNNNGLFASLAAGVTVMSYDEGATLASYGEETTPQDVLFGNVKPTPAGQELLNTLTELEKGKGIKGKVDSLLNMDIFKRKDKNEKQVSKRSEVKNLPLFKDTKKIEKDDFPTNVPYISYYDSKRGTTHLIRNPNFKGKTKDK